MNFDELIGARLVIGFPGTEPTRELIAHLKALHAQTIIIFERNVASPEQWRQLIRGLEDGLGRRLLVMVDQEGGRVARFRSGVTRFPDAMTMARSHTPEEVERQGRIEAEELRSLGIVVNLAPCVDVVVDGCDPIIGDRSYGTDPAQVAAYGAARIRGLQRHGVAACAKHFPGLGAVPRDPHKTLPTIQLGWRDMEAAHLVPFRAAMEAGVEMIMSSHVCYPGLGEEPGLPATFSPALIRTLLRTTLQFAGLMLTDDLEMGALRTFGTIGDAAIRATEAGHDMLLICSDLGGAKEAFASLHRAYQNGRLSQAELEASANRVARVRKKYLVCALITHIGNTFL